MKKPLVQYKFQKFAEMIYQGTFYVRVGVGCSVERQRAVDLCLSCVRGRRLVRSTPGLAGDVPFMRAWASGRPAPASPPEPPRLARMGRPRFVRLGRLRAARLSRQRIAKSSAAKERPSAFVRELPKCSGPPGEKPPIRVFVGFLAKPSPGPSGEDRARPSGKAPPSPPAKP